MVWGSNPSVGAVFHTYSDRLRDPPSLLDAGYQASFLGVKEAGVWLDHPHNLVMRLKKE
jgi:hypothetical protein